MYIRLALFVSSCSYYNYSAYSNLLQLISTLNKEIVSKLLQQLSQAQNSSSATGTGSRVRERRDDYDPLRVGPPRQPGMAHTNPL